MEVTKQMKWLTLVAALAIAGVAASFLTATTASEANDSDAGDSVSVMDGAGDVVVSEDATESEDDESVMAEDATESEDDESAAVDAAATEESAAPASDDDIAAAGDSTGSDGREADDAAEAAAEAGATEPGFLVDGMCSLSELWDALDAMLESTDFPLLGADLLLSPALCQNLLGMVEAGALDLEEGVSCDLASLLAAAGTLEASDDIPDVALPAPVCVGLNTGGDLPIIFAGEAAPESSIVTQPIVELP